MAVGQYYPSVSLNLSYFLYRETVPTDSLFGALISANIPLFTWGKIESDVRTAWSQFRQAKLSETQLRRRIIERRGVLHPALRDRGSAAATSCAR